MELVVTCFAQIKRHVLATFFLNRNWIYFPIPIKQLHLNTGLICVSRYSLKRYAYELMCVTSEDYSLISLPENLNEDSIKRDQGSVL